MSHTPASGLRRAVRRALPLSPLALAAIPAAQGQVVYTNVGDLTVTSPSSSLYINFNRDGTGTQFSTSNFSGADFAIQSSGDEFFVTGINTLNSYTGFVSTGGIYTARLSAGMIIGSGSTIGNATGPFGYFGHSGNGGNAGFATQESSYLGLTFTLDGNTYYGWVSLSFARSGNDGIITIHDFAYATFPGAPIEAGALTAVPEPATSAALAGVGALLAGSVAIYRRRKQASVGS